MKRKVLRPGSICALVLAVALVVGWSCPAAAQQKVLKGISYLTMSDKELSLIAYKMFIDRVNQRQKEVKVDYLGGPEVIPSGEQMAGLSKGVVQFLLTPGYHTSLVPEVDATLVAGLNPVEQRTVGFYDLMVKVHREKLGVVPLARADYGTPFYLYTNANIERLKDFNGLKFRSNANYDSLFKKLGIVSVNMAIAELYTALERKLVVGFPLPAFISQMGLQTVTKNVIDHGFWEGGAMYIYVNGKVWDSLSAQTRDAITEVSKSVEKDMMPIVDKALAEERNALTKGGMKFVKMAGPDGETFQKMASDIKWDDILKKCPQNGPKMREMSKKK